MPPRRRKVTTAKENNTKDTIKTAKQDIKKNTKKQEGRSKPKKVHRDSYARFIRKVLKQVHPDMIRTKKGASAYLALSKKAMSIMNSLVNDLFERIAMEAAKLVKYAKRRTLKSEDIQASVRLVVSGELAVHAVSEGVKAVAKYTEEMKQV